MLRASVVERIGVELEGLDPLVRCGGAASDHTWGRGAVVGVPRPRCTARARAVARLAWLFLWMPDRRSDSIFSARGPPPYVFHGLAAPLAGAARFP